MTAQGARAEHTLFAAMLWGAIAARGLSLEQVQAHLTASAHDISVATPSHWQTGRSLPTRAASWVARRSRRPAGHLSTAAQVGDAMEDRSRRLGLTLEDDPDRGDASHHPARRRKRLSGRHHVPGARHGSPFGYQPGARPLPLRQTGVTAWARTVEERRIGRTLVDEHLRLVAAEVLLPHTWRLGQAVMLAVAMTEVARPRRDAPSRSG